MSEGVTPATPVDSIRGRIMTATVVGNYMEWFDFAVYGFFATTIGRVFFPATNETTSLLASLAVFGVAFLFRPLGAVLFGTLGDRAGRRAALSAAIIVMSVSTTLIAALPSYATVGLLAPILLVVLRSIQGLSVGGEWTGAGTYLVEYAPAGRRGRWASLISATAALGFMTGSLIALGLNSWLTPEALEAWGWRVPFLVAAPLGVAGLYVRLKLQDTPVFRELEQADRVAKSPLRSVGRNNTKEVGLAFIISGLAGLGVYYLATYMVNYLSETAGFVPTRAILITAGGLLVYALLCPLAGMLSDRIGRRPTYLLGCLGHLVFAVPIFLLLGIENAAVAFLGLCVFGLSQAALNVMSSVVVVELFPAATRLTGTSVGHNLGLAVVSGSGPLVAAWLVSVTGASIAPAIYLAVLALLGGLILFRYLPETLRTSLGEEPTVAEPARHG
ncbi:MAG: MFS transporter [Streptosporangiales bacterium]|nr:MFS transporter [Streptosporangiales bacterium]